MSSKSIREVGNSRVDECSISTAGINLSVCLGGGGIPKFKTVTPPSIATATPSSTYFAIPPGLSPADLLDSPVLLSSSSVLASPTTGALVAQSLNQNPNTYNNRSSSKNEEVSKYSDFTFQTQPPPSHAPSSSVFHHSFPSLSDQIWRGGQRQEQEQESWWNLREQGNQNEGAGASSIKAAMVKTEFPVSQSQAQAGGGRVVKDENPSYSYEALSSHSQQIQNGNGGCEGEREKRRCSEDDGFNWRKYGQKQVKGSENPRSYYKCTFPNCPMKKKIERSLDGQITEIVYKGTHNHPKPVHPRRSSTSAASLPFQDHPHPCLLPQGQGQGSAQTDSSVGTPDNSSISVVDDDLDMPSHTHRSISTVTDFDNDDDADDEQPHAAKRWKADQGDSECMSAAPRTGAVREPRVVVQTTSDIDILDDGYRWRKYGQKVVKGNPNPRSYYKCTHPGCPVRKHVERAAHDLRAVITTYEGKHNHEVPAARGSGLNRALPNSGNSNYYGNSANNNNNNNNPLPLAPSTMPQPQASSSFEMQMLHNPAHSFDFSSFINHPPYYQDNMFIAPPKTKDEPKDDLFLDSLLY